MCLLKAKHLITLTWKSVNRPDIKQWLRKMSSCLTMEKITDMVKGKQDTYVKVWILFK